MHEFSIDLALDGAVLQASDEFLNPAARLLDPAEPISDPDLTAPAGAWLDGWETRRVRPPGHEWAIIRLGHRGLLHQIVVDTTHITTSLPEACSVEAIDLPGDPNLVDLVRNRDLWHEVVPRRDLQGGGRHVFQAISTAATHLRLVIYPDGAIARVRALGEPLAPNDLVGREVDLAAIDNGAIVVDASDARTSPPNLMLGSGEARGCRDGWMTRRRRIPGNEWAIVRLAGRGTIDRIEIDTRPFAGDSPAEVAVMGVDAGDMPTADPTGSGWATLLRRAGVEPGAMNSFEDLDATGPITHLRLDLHPDGAIGRFRAFGTVDPPGEAGA